MEIIIANLKSIVRTDKLLGREHIVVPVTLIVPGILNGSQGPLFYPPEEIKKNPQMWNHIPIVVYHPHRAGTSISARDPDVLNKQAIGVLLRAKANGKLTAEAWIDVARVEAVDNRIISMLKEGKPVEVSTGLFTENEPAPVQSYHNGMPYDYIARNYRPDHLAILPDQIGACSIKDGCGLLMNINRILNEIPSNKEANMALNDEERQILVNALISECDCWNEDDREVLNGFPDEKLQALAVHVKEVEDLKKKKKSASDMTDDELEEEMNRRRKNAAGSAPTKNDATPQSLEDWLAKAPADVVNAFRTAHQIEQTEKDKLISQITVNLEGAEKAIHQDRLQRRSLTELQSDLALLPKPVDPKAAGPVPVQDNDRWMTGILNSLSRRGTEEEDLLTPPTIDWKSEAKDSISNVSTVGISVNSGDEEQWIRGAPPRIRSLVENAIAVERRERDNIIDQLVANIADSSDRYRLRERLDNKSVEELRDLLEIAIQRQPTARPTYAGAAAPAINKRLTDEEREDILPLPSMSFEDRKMA